MTKALDMIAHELLLAKMAEYGATERYIEWFRIYLSGSTNFVCIEGLVSAPCDTTPWVPQGSNLGPLLYIDFPLIKYWIIVSSGRN